MTPSRLIAIAPTKALRLISTVRSATSAANLRLRDIYSFMKRLLLINSIYKITNKINNKIYIGQTWLNISQRFNQHKQDSKRLSYPIHKAIRKYGINNFTIEIITITHTQQCANFWEDYFIKSYKSIGKNGYNAKEGGSSGKLSEETKKKMALTKIGIPRSQETKNRISKSQIHRIKNGGNPSRLGAIVSKQTREKMSQSRKGKKGTTGSFLPGNIPWNKGKKITNPPIRGPMSEATKAKISASKKGNIPWNKGKKIINPPIRKQMSESTKAKLSAFRKGKLLSEETKNKISAALIGNTNNTKKN
jgi:group I intron endonuclease